MSVEPTPATDRLRARARELGFERIGIARAARSRDGHRLLTWLRAGNEAGLEYMRRDPETRLDPRRVLRGCRSVIVCTVGHSWPEAPPADGVPARIARYARGRDYHRILEGMLKRLCRALDEEHPDPPAVGPGDRRHRWYVDTGPVLERGWAAEAGVGFTGKNACLIDPRRGSWSTLGVVLTTVELAPDAPVNVGCGTCTRCIEACPTGAITGPGVVDSRRCISYWTIEHRGSIPEELRPMVGTRVFGCDDCQEVCPWNRFARPTEVEDHRPRDPFAAPDLLELARLSEDSWDAATRGSAVRRAGYPGLLRNVAVALGNSGDPRAATALQDLATHPAPLVREHARWGLIRLEEPAG